MCEQSYAESGTLTHIKGCNEFNLIVSDRDRLAGVVAQLAAKDAEIDALKAQLADFHAAVQHVTEDGNTTRSYSTSDGWAMVHAGRLSDLEVAEEERNALRSQLEKADALVDAIGETPLGTPDDPVFAAYYIYRETRNALKEVGSE